MKTCSILVSNYNSFEAIQLCIESVAKYTKYIYEIIIYDDASTNNVDLEYLRRQRNIGYLELIEGKKRLNHGGALNQLLKRCDTDLAMILDNDIQILTPGWLEDIVSLTTSKTLIIAGMEYGLGAASAKLCYPDWFQTWFMMINMDAYRDGMEIDWARAFIDKSVEPFRSLVKHCDKFDKFERIHLPVGARLHNKILNENPEGYGFVTPIPSYITNKFHHFAHVSCIATRAECDTEDFTQARERKMEAIKCQLKILRGGP